MRSIELFAGAGGLVLAGAKSGLEHLAVVEWDKNACDTIRRNKKQRKSFLRETEVLEGDVRAVDHRPYRGKVDIVSGGPPCQPFSIGGKHKGFQDERDMFPEAVRAVSELRPLAFVFENVKGLLRGNFSNYFNYVRLRLQYPNMRRKGDEEWVDHLARLEEYHTSSPHQCLQYNVVHQLLNAADYGVPQRRERVFIVGIRSDLGISFSFPNATHSEDALIYEQCVSGKYWKEHGLKQPKELFGRVAGRAAKLRHELPEMMLPRWRTVRDAIADLPPIAMGATCPRTPNHFFNPGARSYAGHTGSPYDVPAKTLKAGDHGVPGGENTLQMDDGGVRYFSVRECARLQTFPDEWIFEGSWTESMRQLGNAVPVTLAAAVVTRLVEQLSAVAAK